VRVEIAARGHYCPVVADDAGKKKENEESDGAYEYEYARARGSRAR